MKKIISLFLAVAMIVGCIAVSAAYPTTLLTPPTSVDTEGSLGNITNDNSKYAFTYATVNAPDGASFVLLDKDETTGDYLMATNQTLVDYKFKFDNDINNGWQYNPADETNVAYWVNTHLTSTGGGRALHYIGDIRNYMVEKQWKIEASVAQGLEERTITARAVLPSYTEYKTYGNKLNSSNAYTNNNWFYIWLRTPSNDDRDKTGNENNNTMVMLQVSSAVAGTGNLARRAATSGDGNSGIQLFFWVNRDFFKSKKVGNIGTEVAKQIVDDYAKSELTSLYTEQELVAMGFEAEVISTISNVKLSADVNVPGGTLTVTYDAEPAADSNTVEYYTCNADGSNPVKLDGVSGSPAKIPSSAGDKYICAGVMNGVGTVTYSSPIAIEAALPTYTSTSGLSAWTLEFNNPDYMFSTSYTNFTVLEEDGDEVVVLADSISQGTSRIGLVDEYNKNFDPAQNRYLPKYMNEGILSNDIAGWTVTDSGWQSGSVYGLPASVVPYVNTNALWRTEGSVAAEIDEYVFRAAATVPSATEVLKYKDRIGKKGANANASNNSWPTRTPIGVNSGNIIDVKILGTYDGAAAELRMVNSIIPRFILRIDKDFFKSTRLYLNTTEHDNNPKLGVMGSKVKEMLVANFARSEMAVYTEDELTAMGFPTAEPVVSNVTAQGIASVAQTLTASYTYTDPNSSNEDKSKTEYQWYYADSAEGTLNKIEGATSKTYVVDSAMQGKYIAVGVRVYNTEGVKSGEVKSVVAGPVGARENIVVTPVSINDTKAEFIIDSVEATNMLLLYCVYNKTTGALVHCEPLTQPVTAGRNTYDVDITGKFTVTSDHIVKAMVWENWQTIRPYAMIEK